MITWTQYQCLDPKDRPMVTKKRKIASKVYEKSFCVERPQGLWMGQVFDVLNDSVGEEWLWGTEFFYFARESDAVWFAMRFG